MPSRPSGTAAAVLLAALLLNPAGCKKEGDSAGGGNGAATPSGTPAAAPGGTQPAGQSGGAARAAGGQGNTVAGDWKVHVGATTAAYHFADDGTFTVTFSGPSGGRAGGRWRQEGGRLVMKNETSTTGFVVPGEEELADVASVTDNELTLKSKDPRGRDQTFVLRRAIPFNAGKRDNPKVVGSWRGRQLDTMVLAGDGVAVLTGAGSGGAATGHWSQAGNQLSLQLEAPARRGSMYLSASQPAAQPSEFVSLDLEIVALDDATLTVRFLPGTDAKDSAGRVEVFQRIGGSPK